VFPNQVIRADDLARAMIKVAALGTYKGPILENRDIRTVVQSLPGHQTNQTRGRV
jgi:hypothetical protein